MSCSSDGGVLGSFGGHLEVVVAVGELIMASISQAASELHWAPWRQSASHGACGAARRPRRSVRKNCETTGSQTPPAATVTAAVRYPLQPVGGRHPVPSGDVRSSLKNKCRSCRTGKLAVALA